MATDADDIDAKKKAEAEAEAQRKAEAEAQRKALATAAAAQRKALQTAETGLKNAIEELAGRRGLDFVTSGLLKKIGNKAWLKLVDAKQDEIRTALNLGAEKRPPLT